MPSIKELRQICQHSEQAPSWRTQSIEGKINRVFSIYLTWVLAHTKIPVTAVNITGTLFYIGGAALFIFNDLKFQVAGLILMFISFILDACDGELARYRKLSPRELTVGGSFIEPVTHDVMYAFFFLPIGIGASLASGTLYPIIAAFAATAAKLVFRLLECRHALLDLRTRAKEENPPEVKKPQAPQSLLYLAYRNFFTGTGMFFMLIISLAVKRIDWFLYFYAASFFLFWMYKMCTAGRRLKIS